MKFAVSLLVAAATLVTSSCFRISRPDPFDIKTAIENRDALDGRSVAIKGYMVMDMLSEPNFMVELGEPRGEHITESIDVIPENKRIKLAMSNLDEKFIVIIGEFEKYGEHTIRTGNLVSKYANVLVDGVLDCTD